MALAAAALAAQFAAASNRPTCLRRFAGRDAPKPLGGARPGDRFVERTSQGQMIRATARASVALVALEVLSLRRVSAGRTLIGVLREMLVPTAHPRVIVDAAVLVVGPIIRVQRIVTTMVTVIIVSAVVMQPGVMRAVIIAEVIVPVVRMDEQVQQQAGPAEQIAGPILKARLCIDAVMKINRRIAMAATGQAVIPIAAHEDAALRRPGVMFRHPGPIFLIRMPVTRPPAIIALGVVPTSGNPKMLLGRRRASRTTFEARRRRIAIRQLAGRGRCP